MKKLETVDGIISGLCPIRNDVIVASFILTDIHYKVETKFTKRIRPLTLDHWSEDAEKVHGITIDECGSFQHPFDACIEILKFLAPYKHPENIPMRFIYHATCFEIHKILQPHI